MLKLGIIGTNWITNQFIEAAISTKNYLLHSVYSRTIEKARSFGEGYGEEACFFDSLDAFLADTTLDVVYIASPNGLHFEQAKAAILNGKHIIVEKSAFSNPKELNEILHLTKEKGVLFFEAIRNIHDPSFQVIQKLVKGKEIWGGSLQFAKYSSRMDAVLKGEEPNIFSLKFSGGALMDLGVYLVYPMVALFGVPKDVQYFPTLLPTGVDANASGVLVYDSFQIHFFVGKNVTSTQGSEIYFNDGTLVIDGLGDVRQLTFVNHREEATVFPVERFDNPMVAEAAGIAKILMASGEKENVEAYNTLIELARDVNQVMFRLRQKAGIIFAADEE